MPASSRFSFYRVLLIFGSVSVVSLSSNIVHAGQKRLDGQTRALFRKSFQRLPELNLETVRKRAEVFRNEKYTKVSTVAERLQRPYARQLFDRHKALEACRKCRLNQTFPEAKRAILAIGQDVSVLDDLESHFLDASWPCDGSIGRKPQSLSSPKPLLPEKGALLFCRVLKDEFDLNVRDLAAIIGDQYKTEKPPPLIRALKSDRSAAVRRLAATALPRWCRQDDAPKVAEALLEAVSKDRDANVRSLALFGLMKWPVRIWADSAMKALDDLSPRVRSYALAMCAQGRVYASIPPIIECLDLSDGRFKQDLGKAFQVLTGTRCYGEKEIATRWLETNRERFSDSPFENPDAVLGWVRPVIPSASENDPDQPKATVSFFGTPVSSKRIIFLIDISVSMEEESKSLIPLIEKGSGGSFQQPKTCRRIDVAKWQLHHSVETLPEDSRFNIVLFGSDVKIWRSRLTGAADEEKQSAHAFIDRIELEVGTKTLEGLHEALCQAGAMSLRRMISCDRDDLFADTIYMLSDGLPDGADPSVSLEDSVRHVFRRNWACDIAIHTINIGSPQGRGFMKTIARENGGTFTDFP